MYVVSEPKTIDAVATAVTTLIHTHRFTIHRHTEKLLTESKTDSRNEEERVKRD